ncbi:unnamed protein product [Phytophthora fragariaefolia]|uniref:Unnamed protein product n=1 Tax=Phytophthora fragariaefolia TaxID=1490495 RepID=A0A9W6X2N6_9STRA|nr:unnamed protein product [Phytophthora fragariaefolia]
MSDVPKLSQSFFFHRFSSLPAIAEGQSRRAASDGFVWGLSPIALSSDTMSSATSTVHMVFTGHANSPLHSTQSAWRTALGANSRIQSLDSIIWSMIRPITRLAAGVLLFMGGRLPGSFLATVSSVVFLS